MAPPFLRHGGEFRGSPPSFSWSRSAVVSRPKSLPPPSAQAKAKETKKGLRFHWAPNAVDTSDIFVPAGHLWKIERPWSSNQNDSQGLFQKFPT